MAISSDEALGDRIGRLEADPAISLAAVDLTIVHPERLRRQFDEVFYYFALVEGEVAQNAVDIAAFLPDLDEYDHRFLAVWSAHEVAHSAIFDAIRAELGLPSGAPSEPSSAQRTFRAMGVLAQVRWLHDVLKLVYLARGAMHERLTLEAYTRLGTKLSFLGEHSLARTVTDPIRHQEAAHLGYYKAAAAAHRVGSQPGPAVGGPAHQQVDLRTGRRARQAGTVRTRLHRNRRWGHRGARTPRAHRQRPSGGRAPVGHRLRPRRDEPLSRSPELR